ncbi:MAG TPA: hypothetical protein VF595_14070 [Tepidisphaeraceae bacterium]|jgi:hypothetical protein
MRRRGYLFLDAIVALGLLTAVAMLLVTARSASTRVMRQTDDHRAAVRVAERVLINLAPANPAAPTTRPTTERASAEVVDLPTTAPAGWKWVGVRASVNGRTGEVVGLVRAAPQGGGS